jgi:hypothetical protein
LALTKEVISPSIILILLLLNTGGCSFGYQPLGLRGGYSETELDDSTIVVRYNAPSGFLQYSAEFTQEQHIQFFVLYRCAELTVLKGHDYFVVIDSTIPIQVANSYGHAISHRVVHVVSAGAVVGAIGRGFPQSRNVPTVDTDMQEITIRMFNGEKPATNPLAYDARELLKVLPLKNNALAAALTDRKH